MYAIRSYYAGLGLLGMICLFWPELRQWHPALLPGVGLSLLGTYGFSLGNMLSARHQRQGLDILSTNARAMLYGTGVRGALASALLWLILWASRRLRPLSLRDHGFCLLQGCCVFGFNFYCSYNFV